MKKIAVITSGGDAPGMNAAVRAVVRTALHYKFAISGIKCGWQGLIENSYLKLGSRDVSGIISKGGTILHTMRCPASKTKSGMRKIVRNLEKIAPDGLVVIGGDGSMRAANAVSKNSSVPVIGIPASIDNDIAGTDETIGFDTAINTALGAIDKIRDTATSHDRVFIIEVMGRDSGFLALSAGIASGAEVILMPEKAWKKDEVRRSIEAGSDKSSLIIVMAEGAGDCMELAKYLSDESKKKISKALTGGQKTLEEQKKKGGNPDNDMLFELFKQHLMNNDKEFEKRIKDYKEGKILDSENKKYATKLLQEYMKGFRKKYEQAKNQINKFILKN